MLGKMNAALLPFAASLAYLESTGGVISPDSRDEMTGAQFARSTRWRFRGGVDDFGSGSPVVVPGSGFDRTGLAIDD